MTDREFLIWLHERLEHIHKTEPLMDYMHKLRAIIMVIPKEQKTPNFIGGNSLDELKELLSK